MSLKSFSLIFLVVSFSAVPLTISSQAQAPTAAVNLSCEEYMEISVETSNALTNRIRCVVENPTAYIEKVEISVDSGDFSNSAPGSVYVGPGSSETFNVTIQAEQGIPAQSETITVSVQVTELSGFPPLNLAEDETTSILNILQYSGCAIGAIESFVNVGLGKELTLYFDIYNQGNGEDIMSLELSNLSKTNLEDAGFIFSFPLQSISIPEQVEPIRVALELRAPPQTDSNSDLAEQSTLNFEIEVFVKSDYSCESESNCKTDSTLVSLDLIGTAEDSEGGILSVSSKGGSQLLVFSSGVLFAVLAFALIYWYNKKA
ncbi:MAG: choice-of-anchor T family protein [Candidatus Poseidoniaceae archaeon]